MDKIYDPLAEMIGDIALVALACDGNKGTRMALARLLNSRQESMDRADRAESELAKMKAEIHAAVGAAPDAMADNEGKV